MVKKGSNDKNDSGSIKIGKANPGSKSKKSNGHSKILPSVKNTETGGGTGGRKPPKPD